MVAHCLLLILEDVPRPCQQTESPCEAAGLCRSFSTSQNENKDVCCNPQDFGDFIPQVCLVHWQASPATYVNVRYDPVWEVLVLRPIGLSYGDRI